MKIIIVILIFISKLTFARDIGETEITTDEGIEVFQQEKYYLLKKNVNIDSDTFNLKADEVKIYFENDLYDINKIDAYGKVKLKSNYYNIEAEGEKILFTVKSEEIYINGLNSKLITSDSNMFSNGEIMLNNKNGKFSLEGDKSSLSSNNIIIEGNYIDGKFSTNKNTKEVIFLEVIDKNVAYINTNNTEMYADLIKYKKETSIIELENNVKIIRDGETIIGDYGNLNMNTNSYKVKSKESKKVKVIISNQDE